jgi:heme O synthase-like polyprenyltransferase
MKWLSLTITLSILSIIFVAVAMSESFYLIIVTCAATFFIGVILKSTQFTKKTNNVGWGMLLGSLVVLCLVFILFIWLNNLDGVPF